MKLKTFLLTCAFSFAVMAANAGIVAPPGNGGETKKNDIAGSIVDGDNKKPVSNVNITAIMQDKKEKVITADNQGNYSFDDLKPGTYRFVFEKSGYKKVVKDKVVVKTDNDLQLNVEMFKEADFEFVPQLLFSDFE